MTSRKPACISVPFIFILSTPLWYQPIDFRSSGCLDEILLNFSINIFPPLLLLIG
ncbi:hypothetical protein C2G38_2097837 [Gigaspora rosea]|uniref:Uncharacterized protein n=1 Tax=Gigaspora rosea TaxID=44941 RepID=A0A397UTQ9_9GLOM|nr:hypothetical protein C2G38_2097837 [Gigaspora rosea]